VSKLKQHKPLWLHHRAASRVTSYMLKKAKTKAAKEQTREEIERLRIQDWGKEF